MLRDVSETSGMFHVPDLSTAREDYAYDCFAAVWMKFVSRGPVWCYHMTSRKKAPWDWGQVVVSHVYRKNQWPNLNFFTAYKGKIYRDFQLCSEAYS